MREAARAFPPAQPLAYDHAGNMTDYTQPGASVKRTYVHDSWNRLVKVENRNASSGALIGALAEYEYNGLHWRTVKRADTDQTPDNAIDQQRLMYYNASWQLVEEHIDDAFTPTSGSSGHSDNRVAQNFWGLRYIDDIALRRIDDVGTGAAGSYEGRWFYLTDVQFSVRSLVRANGVVEESIDYDAYGNARYHDPSDFDGDGVANSSDFFTFLNAWYASDRSTDFNRDGAINTQDYYDFLTANGSSATVPSGWISDVSPSGVGSGSGVGPDNQFGFDGYAFNAETGDYTVRLRNYGPTQGRWTSRDPAGYIASLNLYDYINNRPNNYLDPMGLAPTTGEPIPAPVLIPVPIPGIGIVMIPVNPAQNPFDPRNDKSKGCGITLYHRAIGTDHIGDSGHRWIKIDDPGTGQLVPRGPDKRTPGKQGVGHYPEGWRTSYPSDPPAPGCAEGCSAGFGGDPANGASNWSWRQGVGIQKDEPGRAVTLASPQPNKLKFGPGAGKFPSQATCEEIRQCLYQFDPQFRWGVGQVCWGSALEALSKCGLAPSGDKEYNPDGKSAIQELIGDGLTEIGKWNRDNRGPKY